MGFMGSGCDMWFALWDIRRLIEDDTVLVSDELRKLRNVRHFDRPVSIYGGMVELPLIVEESEPRRYFDPEERDRIAGGKLWVEWDLEMIHFTSKRFPSRSFTKVRTLSPLGTCNT